MDPLKTKEPSLALAEGHASPVQSSKDLQGSKTGKLSECDNTNYATLQMPGAPDYTDSKLEASPGTPATPLRPKMKVAGHPVRVNKLKSSR